jgi:hypothetical protein
MKELRGDMTMQLPSLLYSTTGPPWPPNALGMDDV